MKHIADSAVEFIRILGAWWFSGFSLTFLFGVVAAVATVAGIADIQPAFWIAALIIGLIIGPFQAFHRMKQLRDGLKERVEYRDWMEDVLDGLGELYEEGAALRIEGANPKQGQVLIDWIAEAQDWKDRVYAKAGELGKFEARMLRTLGWIGTVSAPRVANPQQKDLLEDLSETADRISELIDKFRPIVWQTQAPAQA
ncbi:MAG: hypothetical protein ACC700_17140 [Anaerolineales bacterium]